MMAPEDSLHQAPTRKRKTTGDDPPPYGSQEYWEARYKKNRLVETKKDEENEARPNQDGDDDALQYHAWYFTYRDLRPLILPLVLGGKIETSLFTGESSQYKVEPGNDDEVHNIPGSNPGGSPDDGPVRQTKKENGEDGESSVEEEREDNGGHDSFEEFDEGDDEDDEPPEREGVAMNGPISVLEIGCGDVPLGKDLALDFISLESITKSKVDTVVRRITCCDFSPAVISMMMEKKLDVNGLNSDSLATLDSILDFETADARKLAYGDESFELILEKGTLDAMLADKENGIKNCQTIIGECARVVKQGGFIVVVSHLNAHVQNGKEWLNQVVLAGLRAKSKNFRWEIEVHGNDGLDALLEAEEDGEALMDENPGPCVYIIYKTGRCQEDPQDADPPSVPVRFYTY